jgi:hypothetical protein
LHPKPGRHGEAPAPIKAALGMDSARIAGGVVLSMLHDPSGGYWRKALGFGLTEPVTAQVVAAVTDFYRTRDSPNAVLQLAPSVLPPDWNDICAAHGPEMVAVSTLFRYVDSAEFAGKSILPSHRGRGAQPALLAARAQAALAAGVRWFIAKSGKPGPGENNPSLNLRRAGFTPLYERRNWIWKP